MPLDTRTIFTFLFVEQTFVNFFSFQGPTYYKSTENVIKESNSLHLLKTKLKKNIIYDILVINLVVNSYLSSHA